LVCAFFFDFIAIDQFYKILFEFYSQIGKHRKHPGGRGNAGGAHHHRINFDK